MDLGLVSSTGNLRSNLRYEAGERRKVGEIDQARRKLGDRGRWTSRSSDTRQGTPNPIHPP